MKRIAWKTVVSRPMHPLTTHMIAAGSGSGTIFKLLGEEFPFCWKLWGDCRQTDVAFPEDTLKRMTAIIAKRTRENKAFLKDALDKGFKDSDVLVLTAKTASCGSLKKLENKQLASRFQTYVDAFYEFTPALIAPFAIEIYLTKKIKNMINQASSDFAGQGTEEAFRILATVTAESDYFSEQKDLLELAVLREKGTDVAQSLERHAKRFGYLGLTNSFLSEPWDEQYFESAIDQLENPSNMLDNLLKNRAKELKEYQSFTKNLNPALVEEAELLQGYMLFRSYRIDCMKKAQWCLRPLLTEISRRSGLGFEDIIWFIWPEIIQSLTTGETPNTKPRKKQFTAMVLNNKFSYNTALLRAKPAPRAGPVRGVVACKGTAEGTVRLVLSASDLNSFEKNEVLVTHMTTPDMVVAMRKASAIVTDEGGALCHAAIVSRELGIPCITATEIATKVFKNGDRVKVDAEKGIIKKIR